MGSRLDVRRGMERSRVERSRVRRRYSYFIDTDGVVADGFLGVYSVDQREREREIRGGLALRGYIFLEWSIKLGVQKHDTPAIAKSVKRRKASCIITIMPFSRYLE